MRVRRVLRAALTVDTAALALVVVSALVVARRSANREASPARHTLAPIAANSILLVVNEDASGGAIPSLRSALEQKLRATGRPVADARPVWDDLVYGRAELKAGVIDRLIPDYWPAALRPDWEAARAYCVAKAGRPPYGIANIEARLCGLQIAPILWQKWIDYARVKEVVVAEVHRTNAVSPGPDQWNVEAYAYEPGSIDEPHLFRGEIDAASLPSVAGDLAVRVVRGEGRVIHRTVERQMPDSPEYHAHPVVAIANEGLPR